MRQEYIRTGSQSKSVLYNQSEFTAARQKNERSILSYYSIIEHAQSGTNRVGYITVAGCSWGEAKGPGGGKIS